MAYWEIEFSTKAEKQFYKLDKPDQHQLKNYLNKKILKLEHPKLSGKALNGNKNGLWRYRVDDFRIICKIQKNNLTIVSVKIDTRKKEEYHTYQSVSDLIRWKDD